MEERPFPEPGRVGEKGMGEHVLENRILEWKRHLDGIGIAFESFQAQRILDVGCGPVGVCYFIDAKLSLGIDPLAHQFQEWNGYWGRYVKLMQGMGEMTPIKGGVFDTIFCINVLDHSLAPAAIISEISRVLKPEGILVLHVDLDSPLRRLHKLLRPNCGVLHPHSLSYDWLTNELQKNFHILRISRDPKVFDFRLTNLKYEGFWDGITYRITGWNLFINHVWMKCAKRNA